MRFGIANPSTNLELSYLATKLGKPSCQHNNILNSVKFTKTSVNKKLKIVKIIPRASLCQSYMI